MEINEGIRRIIDGDAIIIAGSGCSSGATNISGHPLPSSWDLMMTLYKDSNVDPGDEGNLQEAAEHFIKAFGKNSLLNKLKLAFSVKNVSNAQTNIFSLPWMRVYTTNYDDVVEFSGKQSGICYEPTTIESRYPEIFATRNPSHCIHINGYFNNDNPKRLATDFKLSSSSYESSEGLLNSYWGRLFREDLKAAKAVFIVGLSLKWDLDLARLFRNYAEKEKVIIVDSPKLKALDISRLSRFGSVFTIGLDGFSDEIDNEKKVYRPIDYSSEPLRRDYRCFKVHLTPEPVSEKPDLEKVHNLLFKGRFDPSLLDKEGENYKGVVYRTKVNDVVKDINNNVRIQFVHSRLGNGKTVFVEQLAYELSLNRIPVFILSEADPGALYREIELISRIQIKNVVVIENYYDYMSDVIEAFIAKHSINTSFVFTARTPLLAERLPRIEEGFNEIRPIHEHDINYLDDKEVELLTNLFVSFSIIPPEAPVSMITDLPNFMRHLINHIGNREFQSILFNICKSDWIVSNLKELIDSLKNKRTEFYEVAILILLTQVLRLRLSVEDIIEIMGIDISRDVKFKRDPAIKELIYIRRKSREFKIRSSSISKFIISEVANYAEITKVLSKVVDYSSSFYKTNKYRSILVSIVSYSLLRSIFSSKQDKKKSKFILNFYNEIKEKSYYSRNDHFRLQYAMAYIGDEKFDLAQNCLDAAYIYSKAMPGYEPFLIDNQQARLYLKKIQLGVSTDPVSDLLSAHKLLDKKKHAPQDNVELAIRLYRYYIEPKFMERFTEPFAIEQYKECCRQAYAHIQRWKIKNNNSVKYFQLEKDLVKTALRQEEDI
ncbi:MAG: hypothetical protein GYA40_05710 [Chloroflexi bacterium]|nr:hypothetical protein [Chloroflexota bacterium]